MMTERQKGLAVNIAVYFAAFCIAAIPFFAIDDMLLATAIFTAVATVIVFLFSCLFSDVSVYDPYWSVAPPVMLIADMVRFRIWNVNAALILFAVGLWSARLTGNWYVTYKGLRHEDWRYAMFREKCSVPVFYFISFFGFHFMPTAVVYAALVSGLLSITETGFSVYSLFGFFYMLAAVLLEIVSDQSIHRFLAEHAGEKRTCDISVWKYSRHPNYLGEMSFWTGMYLYYLALRPDKWYLGLGFLSIIILFLSVSIPMMEKHNAQRRKDYSEYKARTSMVLLLPRKK